MKWTEEEKQNLVASVAKNTKNNRIQWLKVQNDVGKSANLCKSMYIIQLNLKQFTATQKWTFEQHYNFFKKSFCTNIDLWKRVAVFVKNLLSKQNIRPTPTEVPPCKIKGAISNANRQRVDGTRCE